MIILKQNFLNNIYVELVQVQTNPFWLFVFEFDDLNTELISVYLTPTTENSRYFIFNFDTDITPLKTGEYVLRVYEMETDDTIITTGLIPSYIGKVRIYKEFANDNFKSTTLSDERIS